MQMSNFVFSGKPVSFQVRVLLSFGSCPWRPVVQLFQAMNDERRASAFEMKGQRSTGSTLPVIERVTGVACPALSTRFHDGLAARTPHGTKRLFQTLAAPKSGLASVAAGSGPLISGELPNGLLVLNVTLIRRLVCEYATPQV